MPITVIKKDQPREKERFKYKVHLSEEMLVKANVCSRLSMHARHSARHVTLNSLNSHNNLMRLLLLFPHLADEEAEA